MVRYILFKSEAESVVFCDKTTLWFPSQVPPWFYFTTSVRFPFLSDYIIRYTEKIYKDMEVLCQVVSTRRCYENIRKFDSNRRLKYL